MERPPGRDARRASRPPSPTSATTGSRAPATTCTSSSPTRCWTHIGEFFVIASDLLLFLHEVGDADGARRWQRAGRRLGRGQRAGARSARPRRRSRPRRARTTRRATPPCSRVRALARRRARRRARRWSAGHGWGAFGAELLAAAGRASALVLVDGLGGPWVSPQRAHGRAARVAARGARRPRRAGAAAAPARSTPPAPRLPLDLGARVHRGPAQRDHRAGARARVARLADAARTSGPSGWRRSAATARWRGDRRGVASGGAGRVDAPGRAPSGSRACPTASARPRRRARARAAPCSPRCARGSARPARRASARSPSRGLHDRGHPLAPALVGHADDDGVEHRGVGLQRGLDLLGVDLLAAGVDRHRAAAEHGDRAVGLDRGHVAGHRPAHAVDDRERGRRLLGVLVVAERMWPRRASRPTTPDPGATGRRSSSSTVVSSFTAKRGWRAGAAGVATIWPWPPVSDAPKPSTTSVDGSSRTQRVLHRRREDRAAREDHGQRRQVPGRLGPRPRARRPADGRRRRRRSRGTTPARRRSSCQQPRRVEAAVGSRRRPCRRVKKRPERHPVGGAVHERAGGQRRARRRCGAASASSLGPLDAGSARVPAAAARRRRCPRAATARPSACRSCRRCRGCRGRRPSGGRSRGRATPPRAPPRSRRPCARRDAQQRHVGADRVERRRRSRARARPP